MGSQLPLSNSNPRRGGWALLSVLVASSMLIWALVASPESDDQTLSALRAEFLRAPKLNYPDLDVRGNKIKGWDKLAVFPDCNSCSDFRQKCLTEIKRNLKTRYLILTPDTTGLKLSELPPNCYVFKFKSNSEFASLRPGMYQR